MARSLRSHGIGAVMRRPHKRLGCALPAIKIPAPYWNGFFPVGLLTGNGLNASPRRKNTGYGSGKKAFLPLLGGGQVRFSGNEGHRRNRCRSFWRNRRPRPGSTHHPDWQQPRRRTGTVFSPAFSSRNADKPCPPSGRTGPGFRFPYCTFDKQIRKSA